MTINPPKNPNYCATVVALEHFKELAGCDRVQAAIIHGNQVIVGKDVKHGDVGLFFPLETQLDTLFLRANNLFRDKTQNADPTKVGYFEPSGRIKAVKFRGHKSEGFFIPSTCLEYMDATYDYGTMLGAEFDEIDGLEICRKYVPPAVNRGPAGAPKQGRKAKPEDNIVDGQFHFHIDTENLRRNIHKINPDDFVSISDKWHGTSAVFSNVLVKRELTWLERLAKRFGVAVQESKYGLVWSSRRVVKGVGGESKADSVHFYGSDIWGVVAKEIADRIPKGWTLYGEIVGYTPEGKQIQKGYTYGCEPGKHRFLVYRITVTNEDGKIVELSDLQMREFCDKMALETLPLLYSGRARNWVNMPESVRYDSEFGSILLEQLEHAYIQDGDCTHNPKGTPAEGIVVRVEKLDEFPAYKLKNYRFLMYETKLLDAGEVDTETVESTEA